MHEPQAQGKRRRSTILWYILVLGLVAVIGIPALGTQILNKCFGTDVSGWVQAGIALISFPVILYELNQIRQGLNRKPQIEIGLVNIKDLPFSKIRERQSLLSRVDVSAGYAHFYVILRNHGTAPARYVKVYIEHINRSQQVFPTPLVKVSEFSENKPSFVHEHNFDFVFRSGASWIINPDDFEPFGFHITTSIVIEETNSSGEKLTHTQYPSPCEIILDCIVWAEGLDQPIKKRLFVNVVEYLEGESNGN